MAVTAGDEPGPPPTTGSVPAGPAAPDRARDRPPVATRPVQAGAAGSSSEKEPPTADPPPARRSLQAPARARHARPLALRPAEGPADWATPFLALLGVGLLVSALITFGSARWLQQVAAEALAPAPPPPGLPVEQTAHQTAQQAAGQPVQLPAELPVGLKVPAIDLSVVIEPIGLNDKKQILPNFGKSAWYNQSPAPGQPGQASVIAGHVDSRKGPDVFYRLHTIKPGQEVAVRTSTGATVSFTVDEVVTLPKEALADSAVWKPGERPRLALITCGGKFDKKTRSYADNVVVYATLSGRISAQAPRARVT